MKIKEFDLASAIWVIASNDDRNLITYEGIKYRLRLNSLFLVKSAVEKRPELFRPGASNEQLEEWKTRLRAGRNLPSWIKDIEDDTQRRLAIENLNSDSIFRSQFRTKNDSPQSSLETIEWGLKHIDRIRKADLEKKDISVKSTQIWIISVISVLNLVLTVAVAFKFIK